MCHYDDRIRRLEGKYVFVDGEAVVGFLMDHPGLVSVLEECWEAVERYLGSMVRAIELEVCRVVTSPFPEAWRRLSVTIQVDDGAALSLERVDRFEQEWWSGAVDRTDGLVDLWLSPPNGQYAIGLTGGK